MKRLMIGVVGAGLVVSTALAQNTKTAPRATAPQTAAPKATAPQAARPADPQLKDTKSKAAYSIGLDLGRRIKAGGIDIDGDILARGLKDGLTGKAALTDQEIQEAMQAFNEERMAQVAEAAKGAAEKNKQAGQSYLAKNAKTPGVKTLPSGLQYKILKAGTGKVPSSKDVVRVNYRGTLIDGTEFDSSEKNGGPVEFPVTGVIKGWTEALLLMKAGSKWQLVIPPELAYGEAGTPGGPIGPGSTLVFDVELLSIASGQ
ncbi:MAG: FKBP-type peptidyl-prolyl cis-trans isomerase [Isosphaeraceae bacterium]